MKTNLKQQRRCRRRTESNNKQDFQSLLSNAQHYSIGKLKSFGYILVFVRQESLNAYLKQSESLAVVSPDGYIDFNPSCQIR